MNHLKMWVVIHHGLHRHFYKPYPHFPNHLLKRGLSTVRSTPAHHLLLFPIAESFPLAGARPTFWMERPPTCAETGQRANALLGGGRDADGPHASALTFNLGAREDSAALFCLLSTQTHTHAHLFMMTPLKVPYYTHFPICIVYPGPQ